MRQGVGGQRIDHRAQRRRRIGSGGQRIAPDRQLAVGTGTARDDLAGMGHFRFAAEMIGILGHQGEDGCESRMAVMSAAWFVEFRQRLPWLLHVD